MLLLSIDVRARNFRLRAFSGPVRRIIWQAIVATALGFGGYQAKVVAWYEKAAAQGHAKAQFNLGLKYEDG